MKKIKLFGVLIAIGLIVFACKKDDKEEETATETTCDPISFSAEINTIFAASCATSGCHDAATAKKGIILETHAQIKESFVSNKSLCAIKQEDGCKAMPIGGTKLSADVIAKIDCWITQGYLDN